MKNKLITILIIFTMLFSMTIPTFATDGNRETTLMLTGLGDSIASGCVNTDFVSDGGAGAATIGDQDFREFVKFTNGKKNYNCDAVEMSFVSKLYRTFGANQYSKNLAFPGLRAKDFCNIVGLEPLEDGDYYDNWWYVMQSSCTMGLLCNEYNSQVYKSAIKHSDIIVIELGENDMTSTLLNNYEKI